MCISKRTAGLICGVFLAGCSTPPRIAHYPEIDPAGARPVLLAAQLNAVEYLPPLPQKMECAKPGMVCVNMDPPPYWLRARVKAVVYGGETAAAISAATTSHYGMAQFGAHPMLGLFRTDGTHYILQRYAYRPLYEKRDGSLHLVLAGRHAAAFLPCDVLSLREEYSAGEFKEPYQEPGTEMGTVPRFAISVDRLAAFLRGRPLTLNQFGCSESDTAAQLDLPL